MIRLGLIHGFLGTRAGWDAVRAALPVEIDARPLGVAGHDGAPPPADFDAEVARLAGIARDEGLTGLVGYSLGARLALGVAAMIPLEHLVLVSGRDGLDDAEEAAQRRIDDDALAHALEQDGLEAFVTRWEALPLFATQRALDPALRAAHRARRLSHDPHALAAALRALSLGRMPRYAPRALASASRVALVVGERDAKFRTISEVFAASFASPSLTVVPGAGHDVVLERPDALARLLAELP